MMDDLKLDYESQQIPVAKYAAAFNRFAPALSEEETKQAVANILEAHFTENFTPEVLKKIHGCIDLTSLTALDTKESIWKMVDQVNDFEGTYPDVPNVAAICVYPLFVPVVKQALTAEGVDIAAVAGGFPASQTFMEVKMAETAMVIMEGATEIDIVMNLGYLIEENYDELIEEIQELKERCGEDVVLKVILETGALASLELIRKAAILALYSDADFIKTSTGKGYPGATPEAVYTLCRVLKEYAAINGGRKVGIKVAGGVRSAEEAVKYYTIVKEVLGESWLNPSLFRIGASSLVGDIEKRIG